MKRHDDIKNNTVIKNEGYRSSDLYADLIKLLRVIITLMIALVD